MYECNELRLNTSTCSHNKLTDRHASLINDKFNCHNSCLCGLYFIIIGCYCPPLEPTKDTSKMTTPNAISKEMVVRDLLPIEQEFSKINRWMHISTLTWFAGNHEAAAGMLQRQVSDLLVANPWLTGRFERHFCNCKVVLVHPQSISKNSNDVTKKHFRHVPPKKRLCRKTPMENLAKYCNKFYATQSKCLWKVTVIPCWETPNEHFAVIHSMSHVIADGFTYYRIHNIQE